MMLSRSGWVLAGLAVLSVGLLGPDAYEMASEVAGSDFPQALLALGSLVQLTLSLWVLVIIGLSQLRVSSLLLRIVAPRMLRRALFVGAVGSLAVAPAQADRGSSTTTPAALHSLDGLRLPDRPVTSPSIHTVVVRPGDTLWAIAARSLPPGASNAEIAHACDRWYAANRAVIGDDPDLIHPSQHLTPPTKDRS
ncbi:hypothetical protein GCM10022234_06160 [Aeromicrobium panaciterrae]|uniref:LysM peptidoglycan-binding domain-containing protein n=1 Tax=Aeromicrobium panaciterrae TaxID=363861 RepID=UPI0031D22053